MTTEKIVKLALRHFKDMKLDDLEELCLVHIDNIISQEQAVVPYGKSHKIISTDSSSILFISTRQSP